MFCVTLNLTFAFLLNFWTCLLELARTFESFDSDWGEFEASRPNNWLNLLTESLRPVLRLLPQVTVESSPSRHWLDSDSQSLSDWQAEPLSRWDDRLPSPDPGPVSPRVPVPDSQSPRLADSQCQFKVTLVDCRGPKFALPLMSQSQSVHCATASAQAAC